MINQKHTFSRKCIAVLLTLAAFCAIPAAASAATPEDITPYASYYFTRYGGSTVGQNRSKVIVSYDVFAYTHMDWLGADSLYVYESNGSGFKPVARFANANTGGIMLAPNEKIYGAMVTYDKGIRGAYYYSVINFFAQNSAGSEYRAYTTTTIML